MRSELPVFPTEEDRAAAAEAYYKVAVPAGHRVHSWVISGTGDRNHIKELEILDRISVLRAMERARVKEACATICRDRSIHADNGLRDAEAAECAEAIRRSKI